MSAAEVEQQPSTPEEPDASSPELTQESAFDVLSCARRRYVLHHLLRDEQTLSVTELSRQVAAWENDVDVDSLTYQQRMRAYTSLRQLHLPKLDAEGLVDYDKNRGTVTLTDDAAEIEVYLEVVPHKEIRWSKFYLGLGVLSAGAVVGQVFGIVPLSWIPAIGIAGIVTALFLGSAIAHTRHDANNRLGEGEEPPV